jgi:DNA-binding NarL/FixJ family response regulator
MLYICSKLEVINNYWIQEFDKRYSVKSVDIEYFTFDNEIDAEDIFVLDIDQFKTNDDLIDYLKSIPKSLKVVAILDEPKLAHGTFMIKKGLKSYLGKKTSKLIVDQALNTVKNGNVWLYPELMNYIIKHINLNSEHKETSDQLSKLSTKEQQVANLVADGLSNKEISQTLDIQLVTVKKHISSIFNKLNIKDRVSLAILVNK